MSSDSLRKLLLPLIPLYRLGLTLRELRLTKGWEQVRRLNYPVVSIGNLTAGGSGKTPLTIALAQALTRSGIAVDVLSRGYGRASMHPAWVDPDGSAADYGDEPLLIARSTGNPVYVARQRYEAGLLAESTYGSINPPSTSLKLSDAQDSERSAAPSHRLHLLDDGFQHRQLYRDLDVLLLSRADWRDRPLPAGNLREPLRAAMRAGVLAIPADDPTFATELRTWGWQGPLWHLHRFMDVPTIDGSAIAFCGIARPRQFFAGLEAAGVPLAVAIAYPDHHRFTPRNLRCIVLAARSHRATALVTTEKDLVRLGPLAAALPADLPLRSVRLRVQIENESAAIDWLTAYLKLAPEHPAL
jgi:tetraacyldisaccharide 4'-kinase